MAKTNRTKKLALVLIIATAIIVWFVGKTIDACQVHNSAVVSSVLESR
jgi:hypothetical protein